MTISEILSITIVLAAVFAYVNHRLIKWPPTIGIMVISLSLSMLLVVFGSLHPFLSKKALQLASSIDFQYVLMNFMLSFLLFAGAIHINADQLRKEKWPVLLFSTLGTLISTTIVGSATWLLFQVFHYPVPFIYCLLFGSLISPTDPIAVLAILKNAKIPSSLELKISGESLFNDGVAVVIFITLFEAAQTGAATIDFVSVSRLFLQEAVGGVVFGAVLGYAGYYALRPIDDYKVEVLVTLAIVMGGYFIAGRLHISGPLAMVVAGIITGNKVKDQALSHVSRDYLGKFWELIDEILNAVLFLFIGLEMLVIKINTTVLIIGAIMILVVLLARWVCVLLPVQLLQFKIRFEKHAIAILTWGGLRGGLSVALALSLTATMHRDEFVLITYMVVVFSILVQGLSIGWVTRRLLREN
ncbi:sodium:proton antiporter [Mucilaginibacter sp. L3T2-6]|uniref:cation:proton antiporter n=1 Tax=Mucilaginibacter sp. L3T2-6 TaxID=3062491 RepID=UPI002675F0E4|nr:sodium:proton antiporter [Mucilaginibacter sp. L3T2-6]MDO3643808.1 sodium:proton antiporter [Mucilaginibacter sp. L3T2-6]MDV6216259.1 sodium:proton antiporter [Mucilaginibacter sp. L3T2-6]